MRACPGLDPGPLETGKGASLGSALFLLSNSFSAFEEIPERRPKNHVKALSSSTL
jgi:hypothetical protein